MLYIITFYHCWAWLQRRAAFTSSVSGISEEEKCVPGDCWICAGVREIFSSGYNEAIRVVRLLLCDTWQMMQFFKNSSNVGVLMMDNSYGIWFIATRITSRVLENLNTCWMRETGKQCIDVKRISVKIIYNYRERVWTFTLIHRHTNL